MFRRGTQNAMLIVARAAVVVLGVGAASCAPQAGTHSSREVQTHGVFVVELLDSQAMWITEQYAAKDSSRFKRLVTFRITATRDRDSFSGLFVRRWKWAIAGADEQIPNAQPLRLGEASSLASFALDHVSNSGPASKSWIKLSRAVNGSVTTEIAYTSLAMSAFGACVICLLVYSVCKTVNKPATQRRRRTS